MTNKTLECPDADCDYTARRAVSQGMRGMKHAVPEYGRCPHGHGDLVERVSKPKNRKPMLSPEGRQRRHQ